MCGIAGIFDLEGERSIDPRVIKRMTNAIAHRGPDGEGFFDAPGVAFGHRRLAIIDREGGAQPFIASDRESALCFNGEIYNHHDLGKRLEAAGVRLRTRSDTETLAEGLSRESEEFVGALRGMFAFAFWDARRRKLTLARDRFGEKPLYYATTDDGFLLFASEIGAIRASGLVPLEHSAEAISQYCLYGYVPDPLTIYEGAKKLPPATIMSIERGRTPSIRRYWRAEFNPDSHVDADKASAELLALFDEAVASQLESDVPLGAFLSGGVDSSSIVAAMSLNDGRTTTCTIGFDDDAFDERQYAEKTTARYATDHHVDIASLDATNLIDRVAGVYGEPFADPSALPTYLVAAAARRHVTVALSGDGGDEVFGGYRRYRLFDNEERLRRLAPAPLRRAIFAPAGALFPKLDWAPRPFRLKTTLQALGEDSLAAYARAVSTCLPDRLAAMLSQDFKIATRTLDPLAPIRAAAENADRDAVSLAQKIDIETWLPGRMLTKVDRASMAHGLEVRTPFLDWRLAEWAFALPRDLKIGAGQGKSILKTAQKDRVDHDILYRAKQGFSPPVANWLRAEDALADRLRSSSLWKETGIFKPAAVDRMIARHASGVSDYSQELWMLIMFDAFLRREKATTTSASSARASASLCA